MTGLLDALKLGAGAIIGGIVVLGYALVVVVPAARENERQIIRAETLERAIDLYQERSRTNADVQRLSDSDICRELGGVFIDGVCG